MHNILVMLADQNITQPSIVLMDGNLISYEKDASETGETNRLVIRQQLAGRLGDPMPIFSEIGTNVGWNRWQDIIMHKPEPDIVIVHWSSFEKDGFDPNKDVLSCHPASGNRCADRIMNGLRLIIKSKSGSKSPRIIIYSRAMCVCSEEFRNLLRQRIPKDEKYMNQHFSLLSMNEKLRGASFKDPGAVDDLTNLVLHLLGRPNVHRNDPGNGICTLG